MDQRGADLAALGMYVDALVGATSIVEPGEWPYLRVPDMDHPPVIVAAVDAREFHFSYASLYIELFAEDVALRIAAVVALLRRLCTAGIHVSDASRGRTRTVLGVASDARGTGVPEERVLKPTWSIRADWRGAFAEHDRSRFPGVLGWMETDPRQLPGNLRGIFKNAPITTITTITFT